MIINIGLWESPMFGDFGNSLRSTWSNPTINTFLQWNGETLSGLPAIPVFEFFVGLVLIVGIVYFVATGQRAKEDTQLLEADAVTGEAAIA